MQSRDEKRLIEQTAINPYYYFYYYFIISGDLLWYGVLDSFAFHPLASWIFSFLIVRHKL